MSTKFSIVSLFALIFLFSACHKNDSCDPGSTAVAGPDQDITGTTATMAATTPVVGKGLWTISSGVGGQIADPTSATSQFTGTVNETYVLKWTVSGCPISEDEVTISFNNNPHMLAVDKTTVINGEIITITGMNFSSNFQAMSQVKVINQSTSGEIFLPIISFTSTEIKATMIGSGIGGVAGTYKLYYGRKVDGSAAVFFESSLLVTVSNPTVTQFSVSSTLTSGTAVTGNVLGFGVKNASLSGADYLVSFLKFDFQSGISTEYAVSTISVTPGGYGGSMDQVNITVPSGMPTGNYRVRVTYNSKVLVAGWNQILTIN